MIEDQTLVLGKAAVDAQPTTQRSKQSPEDSPFIRKLTVFCHPVFLDALSAVLFEAGAGGLEEVPGGLAVYPQDDAEFSLFQAEIAALESSLNSGTPLFDIKVTQVSTSWNQTWQKELRAEALTPRLVFRPIHDTPAPDGEETLWFQPEASFGAGEHPTTRLAAAFIEAFVEKHPNTCMFDVGCGSGVLTLVARLRGAGRILAADIDATSVASTKANLEINGLTEGVEVLLGSVFATTDQFDLVVANINTPILRQLSGGLAQRLDPQGTLVLTGLLEEDVLELTRLYEAHGLELKAQKNLDGWALLEWKATSEQV